MKINADKNRYVFCGTVGKSRDEKYNVGIFRGKMLWLFLENKDYENIINMEFPTEFYKSKNNVPKYTVMRGGKKIGSLMPRVQKETGDKYLFFSSYKKYTNKRYYIWNVDDNYDMKKGLLITFDIKSDFY